MKRLILLSAWVVLASYVIYRVKVANRDTPVVADTYTSGAAFVLPKDEPAEVETRAATQDGGVMVREAGEFRDRAQLLSVSPGRGGEISPLWSPLQGGGGSGAYKIASQAVFDAWKLYETEELSFYYPAAEGFRVEVWEHQQPPSMLGEIYYRADRPADRWYRVVGPGEVTWCALGVDAGDGFDSVKRFPSGEVYHKLLSTRGGVTRASSGSDGRVGRVQWLGRGVRVSLLDWQHSAVHYDAYLSLAASVALAPWVRRDRAALASIAGGAGLETRFGLLERGMEESQVEAVLGRPVGVTEALWVYQVPDPMGDRYYRVPFNNGRFVGFGEDWLEVRKDPPLRGTVAWMCEKTEIRSGEAGGVGYDLGALTDGEVAYIFDELRLRLSTAKGEDWDGLCEVASNLAAMRLEDAGVLYEITKRFLEPELAIGHAAKVLRAWNPDGVRALFVQKCNEVLGDLRWKSPATGGGGRTLEDVRLLLAYAGEETAGVQKAVASAVSHPHADVRAVGVSFCHCLDERERQAVLRSSLEDEALAVRRQCAQVLRAGDVSESVLTVARGLLEREADSEIRESIQQALAQNAAAETLR